MIMMEYGGGRINHSTHIITSSDIMNSLHVKLFGCLAGARRGSGLFPILLSTVPGEEGNTSVVAKMGFLGFALQAETSW